MPPALEEDEEIKLQNLKRDLVKVTDEYIMENKEKMKSGQHGKYINLTKSEGRGLESLQKRKDIVVFQTDTSGRLAADSKESYVEAAMPHVREDPVVVDKQGAVVGNRMVDSGLRVEHKPWQLQHLEP